MHLPTSEIGFGEKSWEFHRDIMNLFLADPAINVFLSSAGGTAGNRSYPGEKPICFRRLEDGPPHDQSIQGQKENSDRESGNYTKAQQEI